MVRNTSPYRLDYQTRLSDLIKKGDKQALALFGYENADSIQLHDLTCQPKRIVIGESLEFSFYIHSDRDQK